MQTDHLKLQSALSSTKTVLPKDLVQHLQSRGILGPTQSQLPLQQPQSQTPPLQQTAPSIASVLSRITSLTQQQQQQQQQQQHQHQQKKSTNTNNNKFSNTNFIPPQVKLEPNSNSTHSNATIATTVSSSSNPSLNSHFTSHITRRATPPVITSSPLPPIKLNMDGAPHMASAEFKSLLDNNLLLEESPEHLQAAATLMDTLDAYSDALQNACAQLDGSSLFMNTPTHLEVPPVPVPVPPPPASAPSSSSTTSSTTSTTTNTKRMECFPPESVQDFKHVLYNLLVENHNDSKNTFIQPFTIKENGYVRMGFRFNPAEDPEKRIPELYAQHIKKARLDWEDSSSIFIQDLYRYYMRACVELMSKYFEKRDKYTFLYDDVPLFVPNEGLEEAEIRLKSMKSRARKKRKMSFSTC